MTTADLNNIKNIYVKFEEYLDQRFDQIKTNSLNNLDPYIFCETQPQPGCYGETCPKSKDDRS